MTIERPPSSIAGVSFGSIERHRDARGSFRELWRADPSGESFVQANLSTSAPGVLRGMHLHRRQLDYWVVSSGRAFVAVVDIRGLLDESTSTPAVETRVLDADDWVVIPVGVAHGFLALEPLELLYFVTNWYDGSDEFGFAWDDPEIGVPWPEVGTPDGRPIVSDRDASNPSLTELVARLRSGT